MWARLQSTGMAIFDEILVAEKAQILGAGAQNCCQVAKVAKYVLKTMKLELWGQIDSGKRKAGC